MDSLEMAGAYTGTGAFSADLGAAQHGILPGYYRKSQAISEQPLGFAPNVNWSLINNFGAGDGYGIYAAVDCASTNRQLTDCGFLLGPSKRMPLQQANTHLSRVKVSQQTR